MLSYMPVKYQDIVRMKVSFWKGDTRNRSFKVETKNRGVDDEEYEFTSKRTNDYENYYLYSDETEELCVESINLGNSEWFSPNEVRCMATLKAIPASTECTIRERIQIRVARQIFVGCVRTGRRTKVV